MANYEELKKEFLALREAFNQCEEYSRDAFQEHIKQHLANKTPEEAQLLADIMLECVNQDIEKADALIMQVQLRKILEKYMMLFHGVI